MVKKTKITWDDEAKKSLRSVYDLIKHKESIRIARRVRTEILKQVSDLKIFPDKFEQESYLKSEKGNFRYKVVWSYKIIYVDFDLHIRCFSYESRSIQSYEALEKIAIVFNLVYRFKIFE